MLESSEPIIWNGAVIQCGARSQGRYGSPTARCDERNRSLSSSSTTRLSVNLLTQDFPGVFRSQSSLCFAELLPVVWTQLNIVQRCLWNYLNVFSGAYLAVYLVGRGGGCNCTPTPSLKSYCTSLLHVVNPPRARHVSSTLYVWFSCAVSLYCNTGYTVGTKLYRKLIEKKRNPCNVSVFSIEIWAFWSLYFIKYSTESVSSSPL